MGPNDGEDETLIYLGKFSSEEGSEAAESTENKLEREQVLNIIDDEIKTSNTSTRSLPDALLGRHGCRRDSISHGLFEGSVKTHCSARHTFSRRPKALGWHELRQRKSRIDFAYKVRRAMTESAESLPADTLDKLAKSSRTGFIAPET